MLGWDGVSVQDQNSRWVSTWEEMNRSDVGSLILHGRGVVGAYGEFMYLTGHFPGPKGVYAVVPYLGAPIIVVASQMAAGAVADAADGVDVTWPNRTETYLGLVARLATSSAAGGFVGVAAAGGRGLPSTDALALSTRVGPTRFRDFSGALANVKRVKSAADIEQTEQAVMLGERAIDCFQRGFRRGMTEWEGAAMVEAELRREGVALTLLFISCGPYFGQPPSARRLAENDLVTVTVEFASRDGYWIELGSLFLHGGRRTSATPAGQLALSCVGLLSKFEKAISPGVTCSKLAQDVLADIRGCGAQPVEGLGHGVGIDEEPPAICLTENDSIAERTCLALHPSLALSDGSAATGVASMVRVDESGARAMSQYPHNIREIG
jgi:Xaa-Pro aminopeptidase